MALKKSEPVQNQTESSSSLSPELMNQFQNNFATTAASDTLKVETAPVKPVNTKKPNYKNIFNVHMGTGDKARLKTFCAAREVPINTFILYAIEHLIDEIEEGKCSVSKSGIRILKQEV